MHTAKNVVMAALACVIAGFYWQVKCSPPLNHWGENQKQSGCKHSAFIWKELRRSNNASSSRASTKPGLASIQPWTAESPRSHEGDSFTTLCGPMANTQSNRAYFMRSPFYGLFRVNGRPLLLINVHLKQETDESEKVEVHRLVWLIDAMLQVGVLQRHVLHMQRRECKRRLGHTECTHAPMQT